MLHPFPSNVCCLFHLYKYMQKKHNHLLPKIVQANNLKSISRFRFICYKCLIDESIFLEIQRKTTRIGGWGWNWSSKCFVCWDCTWQNCFYISRSYLAHLTSLNAWLIRSMDFWLWFAGNVLDELFESRWLWIVTFWLFRIIN